MINAVNISRPQCDRCDSAGKRLCCDDHDVRCPALAIANQIERL